ARRGHPAWKVPPTRARCKAGHYPWKPCPHTRCSGLFTDEATAPRPRHRLSGAAMTEPAIDQDPAAAPGSRRHRVGIIGSGFGGLFAAQQLEKADVDVTLIAKTGHHLFQPLLYQVATGILSVGEIAPPTRLILRDQKNATVVLGDVNK